MEQDFQPFTPDDIAANPILRYFSYAHLKEPLRGMSAGFAAMAAHIIRTCPTSAERTAALRKLLEAKDCAVRARLEP